MDIQQNKQNELANAKEDLCRSVREMYYATEPVYNSLTDTIVAKANAGDKAGAQLYLRAFNLHVQKMNLSIGIINVSSQIIADELNKKLAEAQICDQLLPPTAEPAPEPIESEIEIKEQSTLCMSEEAAKAEKCCKSCGDVREQDLPEQKIKSNAKAMGKKVRK